jgi:hypothetical protein
MKLRLAGVTSLFPTVLPVYKLTANVLMSFYMFVSHCMIAQDHMGQVYELWADLLIT